MSLSDKIEETFDKLKPHPSDMPSNAPVPITEAPKSKFSLNLEDLRDYLIVLVCFGICIASIFLLIIPQYGQISLISTNFSTTQAKLSELTKQSEYLQSLVGLKDELQSKIAIADQALPATEDRVPYTLDEVVQIAAQSGVTIDTLSLGGISDPVADSTDNLRMVLIQTGVSGSLGNVQAFFHNLENARTIVDISTFAISHQVVSAATGSLPTGTVAPTIEEEKATFTLKSYLKDDTKSAAVDLSALANSPNYDNLFTKLKSMHFYDTTPLDVQFGRDNPFGASEATPSTSPSTTDNEDSSGIQ